MYSNIKLFSSVVDNEFVDDRDDSLAGCLIDNREEKGKAGSH